MSEDRHPGSNLPTMTRRAEERESGRRFVITLTENEDDEIEAIAEMPNFDENDEVPRVCLVHAILMAMIPSFASMDYDALEHTFRCLSDREGDDEDE